MKADKKALWIEALLSEEYAQGFKALANEDGQYCCLGVLCEVAIKDGLDLKIGWTQNGQKRYDDSHATLPDRVVEWAGLTSNNPKTREDHPTYGASNAEIAVLNDNGATFEDLVKVIEADL